MKKIKYLLLVVAIQVIYLQIAYADTEKKYQANIVDGDLVLNINNETKKTKKGESFNVKSGSLICYQEGDGKAKITGKRFKKRITKTSDCISTPREKCDINEKCESSFLTTLLAKVKIMISSRSTPTIAGAARTSGSKPKSGKSKPSKAKPSTLIKLIDLNGEKYLYIENSQWPANKHTLPLTLEVISDLKKQTVKEKKYISNSMGISQFLIPWAEIVDKNNPAQSYPLRVRSNRKNSVLMKPVRVLRTQN